jgi:hypothetical protein
MAATGWGAAPWGGSPWGGALLAPGAVSLELLSAFAVAENVVRLAFNVAPYVSGVLDPADGADPAHYSVAVVAGTVGYDNNPARPVSPVSADVAIDYADVIQSGEIDVVLDRPMSPYPAQYTITVQGLATSGGLPMSPSPATLQFYGLLKQLVPASNDHALPTRDFANPQSAAGISGSTIGLSTSTFATGVGGGLVTLGSFVVDDSGDYAVEQGLSALLKRLYRRAMSKPGAFCHLPRDYGVGLADEVKKLGTASVRSRLAARMQSQFSLEPEVVKCQVQVYSDPVTPQITRFSAYVKTRQGVSRQLNMPFDTQTGQALPPTAGAQPLLTSY